MDHQDCHVDELWTLDDRCTVRREGYRRDGKGDFVSLIGERGRKETLLSVGVDSHPILHLFSCVGVSTAKCTQAADASAAASPPTPYGSVETELADPILHFFSCFGASAAKSTQAADASAAASPPAPDGGIESELAECIAHRS